MTLTSRRASSSATLCYRSSANDILRIALRGWAGCERSSRRCRLTDIFDRASPGSATRGCSAGDRAAFGGPPSAPGLHSAWLSLECFSDGSIRQRQVVLRISLCNPGRRMHCVDRVSAVMDCYRAVKSVGRWNRAWAQPYGNSPIRDLASATIFMVAQWAAFHQHATLEN